MYTVYKVINTINNRYYIGVHKTNKPNDYYLGSGLAIKRAVEAYGRQSFTKEILHCCEEESEAYLIEEKLVDQYINDPLCYNLMRGGEGGFEHINKNREKYTNPMLNPDIVHKNIESRRNGFGKDENRVKKQADVCRQNIQKAIQYNTGRTRPRQSQIMKEKGTFKKMWETNHEELRDKLASTFEVVSPQGDVFVTNRLQDFCNRHNLSYVSLWNTSRTGRCISKGSSKGWLCILK